MPSARDLERHIERLVDAFAERVFSGSVHGSEVAARLLREADLSVTETVYGPQAPNRYTVYLRTLVGQSETIVDDLADALEQVAAEEGWRLPGPVEVRLLEDPDLPKAGIRCVTASVPGPRPAWAELEPTTGEAPLRLTNNRVVLGRGPDADVRVAHPEVSRTHAVVWRQGATAWISDAGSANGTSVNGVRVRKPTPISGGDLVSFGPATFEFTVPE